MVLTLREDGSLVSSETQRGFARHYGDATRSPLGEIFLFNRTDREDEGAAQPTALPHVPRAAHPEISTEIDAVALRYAQHPGVRQAGLTTLEWALLYRANIEIESGYDPAAASSAGAIGLGQLMPATANDLGVDPHDWRQNLDGSARYLLAMLAQFGSPELALAAYNAGPEAVTRHGGIPPYAETQGHVQSVMAVFSRFKGDV
ncbi:lytic transglycosylase domain-containing protein [Pseudogemmobacter humi]|uniref:Membrane-bound lytic transglycosylase F n=1 Tax=Pseudogemmobacter humi TaxID=2483812 RepID=A0A3P5XGT7_9RHOB|nr:lytic transglycosylase domain-containing protein [Pseudogemmobacter humi]VDC34019.1 membrane-bound lytic transglycosylase F [Pseudogemmobacter humi]